MEGTEHFSLVAAIAEAGNAFVAIVCRIGFAAGTHGLLVAAVILSVGAVLLARKQKYGRPLMAVARKLGLMCLVLAIPGALSLLMTGALPTVNALELNSVGLLGFWSLVSLHLCMEEMNFQWFGEAKRMPNAASDEEELREAASRLAAASKK